MSLLKSKGFRDLICAAVRATMLNQSNLEREHLSTKHTYDSIGIISLAQSPHKGEIALRATEKKAGLKSNYTTRTSEHAHPLIFDRGFFLHLSPHPLHMSHITSMHNFLISVLSIHLWLVFHAGQKADALPTLISPHQQQPTVTARTNQTETLSILNLSAFSKSLPLNNTFAPSQSFITYHIPFSPTTLMFHHFGLSIPADDLDRAVTMSVNICLHNIATKQGDTPITTGTFLYTYEFLNHMEVEISVADFREIGRPMTYYVLCDLLRGIGQFAKLPEQKAQELTFEVDVQERGYVGTGHVSYTSIAPSPSTTSVA